MANPSDVDDIAGAAPASDESVQFSAAGICGLSLDASEAEETAVDISEDIIDDKKGKGELCELWRVDKVWKGSTWRLADSGHEENDYRGFALLVQRNFSCQGKFDGVSMIVQAEWLKGSLQQVFGKVKGISLDGDAPEIESNMLHLYVGELQEHRKSLPSESTEAPYLDLLIRYLTREYTEIVKKTNAMIERGQIDYENIWVLFKPGTVVIIKESGMDEESHALILDYISKDESGYKIEGHYLDFDGKKFGYCVESVTIDKFKGVREIHKLSAYPIYHYEDASMAQKLRDRGQRFVTLKQKTQYQYNGLAVSSDRKASPTLNIRGRVVVDELGYREEKGIFERSFTPLHNIPESFTDEELQVATAHVYGFALQQKSWVRLRVSQICEVERSEDAWDSLVLKDLYKEQLEQLIAWSFTSGNIPGDLIQRKGEGFLVVLEGTPGCGKTLTAEAVAQRRDAPLYSVSAADLGAGPNDVAWNLRRILHRASCWHAILLFDEADAYLQRRDRTNFDQHAAVSVVLRELEQYPGLIFVTTNHIESFDPTIISRTHLRIKYDQLTWSETQKIWSLYIERGTNVVTKEQLKNENRVRGAQINGREIKNFVTVAYAKARLAGRALEIDDIASVLEQNKDLVSLKERMINNSMYI